MEANHTEEVLTSRGLHFSHHLQARSAGQMVFESGLLLLINLTALIGNLLVCIATYRVRRLQNSTNVLIVALATTDLFFASFCQPISLGVLMVGHWLYDTTTCWVQCFCVYFAAFSTLHIITLTAVNRYVRVVKTRHFNKHFTARKVVVKVLAIWLGIALLLAALFAFGLIRAEFSPAQPACVMFLNRETKPFPLMAATAVFIMVFFSLLPTFIILFCNVHVFRTVKRHFTRVVPTIHAKGGRSLEMSLAELRVTKTLLAVIIAFMLCWLPIMVVEILQGFFIDWWKLPRVAHMLWMYLGALSSAVNPFIYGTSNSLFKREFKAILCWFKRNKRRVTPLTWSIFSERIHGWNFWHWCTDRVMDYRGSGLPLLSLVESNCL